MELLNLIGLVMGFLGSLLLLIDPSLWILKGYTNGYIHKREACLTVEPFTELGRKKLLIQLWLRRIGIVSLCGGFLLQLLPAFLNYFCSNSGGF